jgi:hypothetical protein
VQDIAGRRRSADLHPGVSFSMDKSANWPHFILLMNRVAA